MKSTMLIIGMAIVATTMFSCKGEYTCNCSKIYTDSNGTHTYDDGSYILKDNAARAESQCDKQERTGTDLGGDYSRQCQVE